MRRGVLLNSEILGVIAKMGHTDSLCIADCGLPIPSSTQRIDIALVGGIPSYLATLGAVLDEMVVEEVIVASEMRVVSPEVYSKTLALVKDKCGSDVVVTIVDHSEIKSLSGEARGIIRTGEQTPYANIILKSGVPF